MNNNYESMQEITEAIKAIIADILNGKLEAVDIDNDTPLFLNGLGLDSIDLLQLVPRIEKKFTIKVGLKNHHALKTVNYLSEYVYENIQQNISAGKVN